MTDNLVQQFVTLWVVIDPIGTIPVFVAVTTYASRRARVRIALEAAGFAALVLMFFLVVGQFLINALGISLPAFRFSGGIILFLFALTMIFGSTRAAADKALEGRNGGSVAVFPLAVPSLASPGAILAIVLLTDNNRFSFAEQAVTAGLMFVVLAFALLLMLLASPILRVIRTSGAEIISRIMGMILAAVAADNVISAVIELMRTTEL